jgi:hypothetical protein
MQRKGKAVFAATSLCQLRRKLEDMSSQRGLAFRGHKGKARRFCTDLSGWTCLPVSAAAGTVMAQQKRLFLCEAFFH